MATRGIPIDVGLLQFPDLERQCSYGLAYTNSILKITKRFCDGYDQFAQNLKKDLREELSQIPRTDTGEMVRDNMYRYMICFELFHGLLDEIANCAHNFSRRMRETVVSPLEEFHGSSKERLQQISTTHTQSWRRFRDECTIADQLRESALKHISIEKERFDTCHTLAKGGQINGKRSSVLASQAIQSLSGLLKRASFHRSSLEIGGASNVSALESPLEYYIRHKYRPARDKCKTAEERYTEHLGAVNISMAEYESCREESLHDLRQIESERLGLISDAWQNFHESLVSVDYAAIHHDSFRDFTNALSSLDKEQALTEFHAMALSHGKYTRPKALEPQLPRWRSPKHCFEDIMDLQQIVPGKPDTPFIAQYLCEEIAKGADEPDILLRGTMAASSDDQKTNDMLLENVCQGRVDDVRNPQHACVLLNYWLSSTIEPVIPYSLFEKCCQFIENTRDYSALTRIDEGKILLAAIPPVHKQILIRIVWLGELVVSRGNVMMIDIADTLAAFLLRDPEIKRPNEDDFQDDMEGGAREFVTFLLQHRAELDLVE